jgi:hypothetical protein
MTYTIAGRESRVVAMLGGRNDVLSRVDNWIRDAYIDLGMSYAFEELEATTSTSVDGANQNNTYDYPTYTDGNNNNWNVRAVKALTMLESNNANNNQVLPLVKKPIQWLDRYPTSVGAPTIFCPYKRQVILHPNPSNTYDGWILRWRVWLKPRIALDGNNNTDNNTEILLPDDWMEILDYSSALRGHTELLERDKAGEILQLLHGSEDPRKGRRIVGLIEQKLLQRQAESQYDDWGMRPRIRRYTSPR